MMMTQRRRRRILLITRYFPPLDSIASLRMISWAQGLHAAGYEVEVLTTSKKGQVVVPLDIDTTAYRVTEIDYFDPIVALGGDKKKVLQAGKQRWLAKFYRTRMNERMPGRTDPWILPAIRHLKRCRKRGVTFDWVISSYGPPSAHVVGRWAKKIFDARWIADYRDLWVENASYTGLWPFTWMEKILEKRLIRHADRITTVSDSYRDFLQKKFVDMPVPIPVHTVTNGFDPELIDAAQGDYFEGERKVFRLVYTGALYPKTRDPSPLFEAIRSLLDEGRVRECDLEVLFFGSVADALESLVDKYRLHNVVHHKGTLCQRDAYRAQKSSNALLFIEDPCPKVEGVLTGKLFEYLYVGSPILAIGVGPDSAAGKLIQNAKSGRVCGQDVVAIKDTLTSWLGGGTPSEGKCDFIMQFSRQSQSQKLVAFMEETR